MTKTYFYPETAECLVDLGYPSPNPEGTPQAPFIYDNTMGGFAQGVDIHDYNGDRGGANIFLPLNPSDPVPAASVKDTLEPFYPWQGRQGSTLPTSWYLMRRTVFKNWTVAGIFTRNTDFVIEIDVACLYTNGGFRDEAPNLAIGGGQYNFGLTDFWKMYSRYTDSNGCGFAMKAMVGSTSKGIVKIEGAQTALSPDSLSSPRQTLSLALPNLSPADLASLEIHLITEQFSNATDNASGIVYPHPKVETTLYRLGLAADPVAMRSSGKMSAALTSR